jgi:hypothetical protein
MSGQTKLHAGQRFVVLWSDGCGESTYEVRDLRDTAHTLVPKHAHVFFLVSDRWYTLNEMEARNEKA